MFFPFCPFFVVHAPGDDNFDVGDFNIDDDGACCGGGRGGNDWGGGGSLITVVYNTKERGAHRVVRIGVDSCFALTNVSSLREFKF